MKLQLLEYITRQCVREILSRRVFEDETVGAPAPPADGQGTADQPEIPKIKNAPDQEPSEPQTPKPEPVSGILFVNPEDKSNLVKIDSENKTESQVLQMIKQQSGMDLKITNNTFQMIKDAVNNPTTTLYLYVGEDGILMGDKNLQLAKDSSASISNITEVILAQKLYAPVTSLINEILNSK